MYKRVLLSLSLNLLNDRYFQFRPIPFLNRDTRLEFSWTGKT